ncbi:hypothetical protein M2318_002710 [Metapseudomonas resinovorans]
MAKRHLSIKSLIVVKGREHDWTLTPETAEDLAAFALRLLVDELGTEGARLFLREKFSQYRPDFLGIGRDQRNARR